MTTPVATLLLFHPRTFHERNYANFHVPYSLLAAGGVIDRSEIRVVLFDNNVHHADASNLRDLVSELLVDSRQLVVGISSMIGHQISDGLRFADEVRELDPTIPILWGGAGPTVLPASFLKDERCDFVVKGQGQRTLPETVSALTARNHLDGIPGLLQSGTNSAVFSERVFEPMSEFPRFETTFSLLDLVTYVHLDPTIAARTISYHSSQGCPFSCGFCSEVALWSRRWGGLTPESIVADVEHLVDLAGVDGIKFYDAEFFINLPRALATAQLLVDRGLRIRWGAAVHPRNLDRMSSEQLELLAASGLARVLMGAESAVQEELDLVGKRTDREMLVRVADACEKHEICASFSFVTGYPKMPSENAHTTLAFADELASRSELHEAKVHLFAPYPGTPLFPAAVEAGFVPPESLDEWAQFDYYEATTPWVDRELEVAIRSFNEQNYRTLTPQSALQPKLCPVNSRKEIG